MACAIARLSDPAGTWSERCFQVFAGVTPPALFDVLGLYCMPQIGVYGDDYTPCGPIAIVQAPLARTLWETQLSSASAALSSVGFVPAWREDDSCANVAAFTVFHTNPQRLPCQKLICSNTNEGERCSCQCRWRERAWAILFGLTHCCRTNSYDSYPRSSQSCDARLQLCFTVNLMYHCWCFPDAPFSPELDVKQELLM
jgi:hypothetical protein